MKRIILTAVLTTTLALLCVAPALAADGVPLCPPGAGAAFDGVSMRSADMSGPMIGVDLQPITGVPGLAHPRIYGWNAADGTNWPVGSHSSLPATADQRHPTVLDVGGVVYYAWQQQDDPATTDWNIWLWKGDEAGHAAAGYPILLVSGPAASNQFVPDLGIVKEAGGDHIVLAWLDDRATVATAPQVYMLDLSKDADHNGTPDYESSAPATNGVRVDPSGDAAKGQWSPSVGAKGIFWLDYRHATLQDEIWLGVEVWRAGLLGDVPTPARFWKETTAGSPMKSADYLHATSTGAAWLRLGPYYAGSGWEPFAKPVGAPGATVALLAAPTRFDVSGSAYAVSAGHNGWTDGDPDIFFTSSDTRQAVPVCNVGGAFGGSKPLVHQIEPAISTAPGGYRVIWSDTRQIHNTSGTAFADLAYQLYVALVPTVTLTTSRTSVAIGHKVTFTAHVSPDFSGTAVRFQKGKRGSMKNPGETFVWYSAWKTLKTRTLSATSKAAWTWAPSKKGVYYIRAYFVGGKRYTDVGGRLVPHVPNTSRVIRIVVK